MVLLTSPEGGEGRVFSVVPDGGGEGKGKVSVVDEKEPPFQPPGI